MNDIETTLPVLRTPLPAGRGEGRGEGRESSQSKFFCSVLSSEGRVFPVEIEYAVEPEYVDKLPLEQAAEAFSHYVGSGGEGDVLVFIPGGFEISQPSSHPSYFGSKGFYLLRCTANFSQRPGRRGGALRSRKVVVSTNVAETSRPLTASGW